MVEELKRKTMEDNVVPLVHKRREAGLTTLTIDNGTYRWTKKKWKYDQKLKNIDSNK